MVGHPGRDRVDLLGPRERGRVDVADGGEPRSDGVVDEGRPAGDRRGRLTTHEAGPDDPDVDDLAGGHAYAPMRRMADSGVAPSWSIAMRARTIPAGSACWMMFRP